MKIIILGAGQVGSSVAQNLAREANDITVVDNRAEVLRDLQDRIDIRTVLGPASHPEVLTRAGAEDADMILAVTNSDETNMIACQVAYTLFHTPIKVARVRSQEYLRYPKLFTQEALPVDVLISPEQLVTDYIQRLIEQPEALQVLDFADGRVQLVAVRAVRGGPLVGQELCELRQHMPGVEARVAAIFRRGSAILPEGSTVIEANDEVFFIAARKNIRAVTSELRTNSTPSTCCRRPCSCCAAHSSRAKSGPEISTSNCLTIGRFRSQLDSTHSSSSRTRLRSSRSSFLKCSMSSLFKIATSYLLDYDLHLFPTDLDGCGVAALRQIIVNALGQRLAHYVFPEGLGRLPGQLAAGEVNPYIVGDFEAGLLSEVLYAAHDLAGAALHKEFLGEVDVKHDRSRPGTLEDVGDVAADVQHAGLRRTVGKHARQRQVGSHTADVDDRSAAAAL